jgi:hypothetical protein
MRKALVLLSLVASTASAQVRIGTFAGPTPPPATGVTAPFLANELGQAFFAPAGVTSLSSLTYWFQVEGRFVGGGPGTLTIFPFAGTPPVGAPLFEAAFVFPTSGTLTPVSFSPNITVTPGARYIALVSAFNVGASAEQALFNEIPDSPANTTGDVFYGCEIGGGGCVVWDAPLVSTFEATFAATAVPEPATLTLGATGVVVLALVRRRRRG